MSSTPRRHVPGGPVKRFHSRAPPLQDRSTTSSPVFSSTENSFDKSKLVVRAAASPPQRDAAGSVAQGDLILSMSLQNTSLSSLDDSVDRFDGSESQSSQNQPLQKAHRGQRSPPAVSKPPTSFQGGVAR